MYFLSAYKIKLGPLVRHTCYMENSFFGLNVLILVIAARIPAGTGAAEIRRWAPSMPRGVGHISDDFGSVAMPGSLGSQVGSEGGIEAKSFGLLSCWFFACVFLVDRCESRPHKNGTKEQARRERDVTATPPPP